ncbi:MAG: hypothetical protein JF627_01730 [Alphaproteobacteria bacterium]|nr:hypothetical protein [Alphaproteobacteria bacterium]
MGNFKHAAVLAAGLAAMCAAAPVLALAPSPSLQSFGASRALSAYELSAPGLSGGAVQTTVAASLPPSALTAAGASSFATSALLAPNLALDTGAGLDIAARFTNYGSAASPFLSSLSAPYLALANGGNYAGVTFVPYDNLRLRAGIAGSNERLDRFRFDTSAPTGPLALTYDASQSQSLLGGLSLDLSSVLGLDVTAIASQRSGLPLGLANPNISPRVSTGALSVSAHADVGKGWVTTASFSEGMTQLDPRGKFAGSGGTLHEQSYSIAIAKHGVFGDDALGVAFSAPAPSMAGTFSSLTSAGDMPLVIAQGAPLSHVQETDIQLGYVTNFLDGAVALQTNAAYQTNAQGQRGATAVSLLSRAKIKF